MQSFEYIRPESIAETLELMVSAVDGRTRPLAGGTDLLTLMKGTIETPERLVDIKRLAELPEGIEESRDGLRLGTLTTLADIETNPRLQPRYKVLSEAAAVAATPQLRHMATLGGNLLQRPRCWYYRDPHLTCWLKGGDDCLAYHGRNELHALFSDGPCYAVHPSDLAPALLALDASVELRGSEAERTLALADFFAQPTEGRRRETVIAPDELLLAITVPTPPPGSRSTFLKAMERKTWAFALVSVAAVIQIEAGHISHARLVLGGVAPIPWRAQAAEEMLLGNEPDAALFAAAATAAVADATPLAHNGYKVPLLRSMIQRALTGVMDQDSGASAA